jgi:hypothetical protein
VRGAIYAEFAEPVDRKMKAATAASPFGRRTDP